MGRITTGIGLVSGINSKDIIDQLMTLEARPKTLLQQRLDTTNQVRVAYTTISTRLAGLKLAGTTLKKPSTFQAATAVSSNEDVLTATVANGATPGSFQFQVARLTTTQQTISTGFSDYDSYKVGPGTLTIEQGGGELSSQTLLSQLNGNQDVRRGIFRITDRSGQSTAIDISAAVTLDDVVRKINTSLDVSVRASVSSNGLVLSDLSGKTTGNLIVQDLAGGHAAEDLGLVGSVAANTITGTSINYISRATALDQINDGRGLRRASSGGDLHIALSDGSSFDVNLAAARTIGDAIDAINTAAAGKLTAETVSGGTGIRLRDPNTSGLSFTISNLSTSKAATDLGIETTATGTLSGAPILAGINTVLISSLNGGNGLSLGSISIQDRSGGSATVDLSGARTVQQVLDAINGAGGIRVTASLKSSGNGIQIADASGGAGNLVIGEAGGGTTAADLGVAGTFDTTVGAAVGKNLQRQWVSQNTLLANYNGGKGVNQGVFTITDSAGKKTSIDLSKGTTLSLGDLISRINSRGIGVVASINAHGDGLLLTDTAAGSLKMKVEDTSGTAAADLRLKGEAVSGAIDGSFEATLTLDANDTLATVQTKINNLSLGFQASIINDGSGAAPYRLSMTARNSGRNGRVVFDGGTTALATYNLVEAQDAAVFVGGAQTEKPLLVTAGRNQITGIIPGVTIDLHGVSNQPVGLNVARNADSAIEQVKTFSDGFNDLVDKLAEYTKFDPDTKTRGLLLGDGTTQQVQTNLYAVLSSVVASAGRYRMLADVGLTLGDGAKIEFDEDKFKAAYAADPLAVQNLFTTATVGIGAAIESKLTKLIDPVDGLITRQNKTLDNRTQDFQDRMKSLDVLLAAKRTRLEKQFSQMESVLANLQSQQSALSQMQTIAPLTSSK